MSDLLDVGFIHGYIRLEQIPAVYYSGQTVIGSVVFDLRRPLRFSTLSIQYIGEANVLWTEYETEIVHGVQQQIQRDFQSHEVYFNQTETLAGGFGTIELPRTHQNFPFTFLIPHTSPSSFNGEYGGVSYSIIATMVYPDTSKEEIKKQFKVIAPLNLNTINPAIKEPIELVFANDVTSCCVSFWNSNSVMIRAKLPVAGYCPGQTIPVMVEVENCSSVEIIKTIFEILSRERYRSRQPPSEYVLPEKVVAVTSRGAVMAHSKRSFTCDVVVPDMIPVYLEHCTCIDVGYFFRATFKLSGCNDSLQDESELCLGLIPLEQTLQGRYVHPMAHELPSGPIPDPPNFSEPEPYVNGSCQNITQSQDNPPPYPGVSAPYPTENSDQYPMSKPNRDIGFVTPQALHGSDVTDANPPPYPDTDFIGRGHLPYPTSGDVNIPMNSYPSRYSPSAPPQ